MTAALAAAYLDVPDIQDPPAGRVLGGAQSLLALKKARQNYLAEGAAVAAYALVLFGLLTYTSKPQDAPAEQPMELVMLPAPPPPVEEPKPPEPEAQKPPEPLPEELPPPPPPPAAVEPAVAPVQPPPPPPPPKPEPVAKPKPKPVAVVKPRPVAAPQHPAAETAVPRTAPPPGATSSAIANQIHARLARAAADAYPESQKPRSAHISYRVQIDASGHVTSFTITPSGNAAFDSVSSRLGGRIGTVEAPGRPAALSGSFTFAYQ